MNTDQTLKRIPCRGCLSDCIYYTECNGHLWRLTKIKIPSKADVSDCEKVQPESNKATKAAK